MKYSELVPLVINAVKDLYAEVTHLKAASVSQQARIEALERVVSPSATTTGRAPASVSADIDALKAGNARLKAKDDKIERENAAIKAWACSQTPKPAFCQ